MKSAVTLMLALGLHLTAAACSIIYLPFCKVGEWNPEHALLRGTVLSHHPDYIELQLEEVWRGEETRPVVRIWNRQSWDCNGLPFDGRADRIGAVGQRVWVFSELVDSVAYGWETPGDYYAGYDYVTAYYAREDQGQVTVVLDEEFPGEPQTVSLGSFENRLRQCVPGLRETPQPVAAARVGYDAARQRISLIFTPAVTPVSVTLYDLQGRQAVPDLAPAELAGISTAGMARGLYFVRFRYEGYEQVEKVMVY
jgi:hypothetical protein